MTTMDIYSSAWDAIADTPAQAANGHIRAQLIHQLRATPIEANHWALPEAAARCGVTEDRIKALISGQFSRFSLDSLIGMTAALGFRVHVDVSAHPV